MARKLAGIRDAIGLAVRGARVDVALVWNAVRLAVLTDAIGDVALVENAVGLAVGSALASVGHAVVVTVSAAAHVRN